MKVTSILQSFKVQLFSKKKLNRTETAQKSLAVKDHVQISAKARSLQRNGKAVAIAKKALQAIPKSRENRVADVRAKIQKGAYAKADFKQALASRLVKSGEFRDVQPKRSVKIPLPTSRTADIRGAELRSEERVAQARSRIASGFYNKSNVRADIADRIMKNLKN
jgi:anti-sigma28 factor (negative regulator of flagellin synthesis)